MFSFGNAASYRYYLPAYMIYALRSFPTVALGALRQRAISDQDRPVRAFDVLDRPQRDAVRAFLRYIATYGPDEADAAELEERWREPDLERDTEPA